MSLIREHLPACFFALLTFLLSKVIALRWNCVRHLSRFQRIWKMANDLAAAMQRLSESHLNAMLCKDLRRLQKENSHGQFYADIPCREIIASVKLCPLCSTICRQLSRFGCDLEVEAGNMTIVFRRPFIGGYRQGSVIGAKVDVEYINVVALCPSRSEYPAFVQSFSTTHVYASRLFGLEAYMADQNWR